jgi:hypothetical protein
MRCRRKTVTDVKAWARGLPFKEIATKGADGPQRNPADSARSRNVAIGNAPPDCAFRTVQQRSDDIDSHMGEVGQISDADED